MEVQDVLAQSKLLLGMRRYGDAERLIGQVLAAEPDNREALEQLSIVYTRTQRHREAESVLEWLLSSHPDSVTGHLGMVWTKAQLQRHREGVPFARRAVELDPGNVRCLTALAEILNAVMPGSAEALALTEQAITIDPDYARAHLVMSGIHLSVHRYAAAERCTLQALRITPADPWALLQLGLARAGLGRFDESREEVLAALRADAMPGNIDMVIEHIERRGVPAHFAEIYRMALTARGLPDLSRPGSAGDDPELIAAQGKLACRMYSRLADEGEGLSRAEELAAAVLASDPDNQDARFVQSQVLVRAGRGAEAIPIARRLLAEGRQSASLILARAEAGVGNWAASLTTVEQALADCPETVSYLGMKAACLRIMGRYEEALRSAQRAAALSPSAPGVQMQLALAARRAGDSATAEHAMRAAMTDAAADKPAPVVGLALLLAETGRWPEAEALIFERLAEIPVRPDAVGMYARIARTTFIRAGLTLGKPGGTRHPNPGELAESARWLGIALRMWTTAADGGSGEVRESLGRDISRAAEALHTVPAPPDSSFAHVVRGFDALLETGFRPPCTEAASTAAPRSRCGQPGHAHARRPCSPM